MLNTNFGIEIEFTGITRSHAATVVAKYFGGNIITKRDCYDTHVIKNGNGRDWKIMSDSSIKTQKKENGQKVQAGVTYSVELVSPILQYTNDINDLQEIVRLLRAEGAFTNETCGIHIHLDGKNHTVKSVKNFINIVASKNDLIYRALQIKPERMRYCQKIDSELVKDVKECKPKTLDDLADIWYKEYDTFDNRNIHYHQSRYHFLNLHSFFQRNHTIELRGFNSELHAGKIRSYIVLALALNNQALTQKSASSKKTQSENDKFAMRTYLNRIGFIGADFKNCREHLTKHLDGCSAWRFNTQA